MHLAHVRAWLAAALVAGLAAGAPTAIAEERVLVKFAKSATAEERGELRRDAGAELRRTVPELPKVQVLGAKNRSAADAAVRRLERAGDVVWAERDVRVRARAVPNDPRYPDIWGLPAIGAPDAWSTTTGSASVTVAVIDTGVMTAHPDLAPNLWANAGEVGAGRETNGRDDDGNGLVDDAHGYDFVSLDGQPEDRNGHGTHVAGTIGARGNDGAGMPGVAWSAKIMPLRVLDEEGSGWGVDVAQAIAYAARHGAQVANLSLGGPFSHAIDDAIRGNPELLAVAAAGNDGVDVDGAAEGFPCELPHANVVCVTATDRAGRLPAYANVGPTSVDIAAPGSDVLSAAPPHAVVFSEDFEGELDRRWTKLDRWSVSNAQSASGSRSLAAAFGPSDRADVPLTAWIDGIDILGYGHCRASLTVWLDAVDPGDRVRLIPAGLSPGIEVSGEAGDVVGRRIGFGIDKRGIYPDSVRFDLELWSERNGAGTRGAVDDVEVRCVDREGAGAAAGFTRFSGTSMAAAFASGAAALVYARRPDATAASVRAALLETAASSAHLAGRVATGGVLRVSQAIQRPLAARAAPAPSPAPAGTPLPLSAGMPGTVDQSFAGGLFRARWTFPDGTERGAGANAIVPLSNGGVVAAGTLDDSLMLVRTREDGSLDSGFGSGGRVRVSLARIASEQQLTRLNFGGMARLSGGRIIVSLTRLYNAHATPLLVRFLGDGRLDTSFGSGGVVQPALGPETYLWHAVVDERGRIHSVFRTGSFIDGIVRFLPDGQIDRSFGENGVHQYEMTDPDGDNIWTGGISFGALHLVSGGKLVTSGCSTGRGREGVISSLRLLENGRLDPTYGDGGRTDGFPFGPVGICPGGASSIGPDGSMTIFGAAWRSVGKIRPFVARWRPDGRVDQSFGLNGIVYLPENWSNSYFEQGVVLSDGRMLALAINVGDVPISLVRLRPDGRWDPGFGQCGLAALDPHFLEMEVDGAGRILVGGGHENDLVMARLHGGRLSNEPGPCERPAANPAPWAHTGEATNLTADGATLSGMVWPNDGDASVRFEYGTTTSYGRSTALQRYGTSPSASHVGARLSGLRPSTTYHYRLVATNRHGTGFGESYTFTTPATPSNGPGQPPDEPTDPPDDPRDPPDDPGDPPDDPGDPTDPPDEPTDPPDNTGDPTNDAGTPPGQPTGPAQEPSGAGRGGTPIAGPSAGVQQTTLPVAGAPGARRGPTLDMTLPRQDLAQVMERGLWLRLACRPGCTVRWQATARTALGRSLGTRHGGRTRGRARSTLIRVRIPAAAGTALRQGTSVRLSVTVTATDAHGGVSRIRRFVTLRPA